MNNLDKLKAALNEKADVKVGEPDPRFLWLFCQVKRIVRKDRKSFTIWYEYPNSQRGETHHTVSPDKLARKNCYAKVSKPGYYVVRMHTTGWAGGKINHHTWEKGIEFPSYKMWLKTYKAYAQGIEAFKRSGKQLTKELADDTLFEALEQSGFVDYANGKTAGVLETQATDGQNYYVIVVAPSVGNAKTYLEEVAFPSQEAARAAAQTWIDAQVQEYKKELVDLALNEEMVKELLKKAERGEVSNEVMSKVMSYDIALSYSDKSKWDIIVTREPYNPDESYDKTEGLLGF